MKLNSLQFGKAMSAALFVLLLVVAGMKNALAQNQMATLQHGDSITRVFYGSNALVSAHQAAVDGDVITLSSGSFSANIGSYFFTLTKNLTIRGAGCVSDTLTHTERTVISGFYVGSNSSLATMEGIYINGNINNLGNVTNVKFVKCYIYNISSSSTWSNSQVVNCIIKNFAPKIYNTSFINSVVRFSAYNQDDIYQLNSFYNSVVLFDNGVNIKNLNAYNSIIATVSDHTISNCTFSNCIGIKTGETSLFEGQLNQTNMVVDDFADVFETFDGTVVFDNIYQLKEEIALSFLGNDGTEVGLYGGMMPYSTRLPYMIMKRCNVASRSTIDGKLSVDIEVLTEE